MKMVTLLSTRTFAELYIPAGPSEGPRTATTLEVVSLPLGPVGESEVRFRPGLPLPQVAKPEPFKNERSCK